MFGRPEDTYILIKLGRQDLGLVNDTPRIQHGPTQNETAHLFSIQRLQRIDRPVTRLRMMLDRVCNRSRRTRPHVRILMT